MPRTFEYYRGKIAEMMANDSDSYDIFYQVDKMFHGEIALPAQLQDLDDVRLIKDSSPHDALYNATVALANSRMRLDVTPLGDAEAEFVSANRMEQALQWNWEKANMRGPSRKIWDISHSALRYDLCVTRVDDLMFWLPKDKSKWSKANKRAARLGRFPITVIPPHNIHTQISSTSGAFCVLSARNLPLSEVLDYYESLAGTNKEGRKIKATIQAVKEEAGNEEYSELRFMLYQYTDDDKRLDYGHLAGDETVDEAGGGADDFIFVDTENKIPFLPYTVRGGASEVEVDPKYKYHPMLASAHWHELWQNSVLVRSLVFSDIIRRVRETREFYRGPGTQDQAPADDGSGGAKALPPNVDVVRPQPTTVDPQSFQVLGAIEQSLQGTTSASAIGNLSRYSNTAFSTMNAIVQVEMGKLNPQKNIIQDTIADEVYLFCEWAKFTKIPIQAWREEPAKVMNTELPRGEEIQIGENDYDLYRTFIKCTITPETPTDKMQQMNIVEKLVGLGMSMEEALEMMNVSHAALQKDKRAKEMLKDGKVNALITKFNAQAQADVQVATQQKLAALEQQKMEQAQAAQAGQGAPGGEPSPTPFSGMGGSGMNPAEGGMPPMEGAPGMGREQMTGMDRTGEDVAA
ncbi:MAG: hypothetical protein EHM40_02830 [Chloroflexi bacterium]|nr:MAG: hypothetical protein EHM40_02830 [Chloroflexota bacterium]